MKVSDYIVDFLVKKGITDVFGYPGGMVTHLMESFSQREDDIKAHVNYHEQAAAFAACGYAQVSGKPGVAYATSGPGATNLLTGICNAFFDSVPAVFITGQVNTFESKEGLGVRQRGFQETDVLSMVREVTKDAIYVKEPEDIRYCLEKAFFIATEGRPGPVVLDIPMNIQRSDVETGSLKGYVPSTTPSIYMKDAIENVVASVNCAKRPCLVLGAGLKNEGTRKVLVEFLRKVSIPVVTSMPAFDLIPNGFQNYYGFIGAYGSRTANFIVAKSDLLITVGTRLDVRQTGAKKENFAPCAKLIRIDIDEGELTNRVKEDETQIRCDAKDFLAALVFAADEMIVSEEWNRICAVISERLCGIDDRIPNKLMKKISRMIPDDTIITTDVGQNQVWTAQSFEVKPKQRVIFSSGHGAMGYSFPAAIGAYYGSGKRIFSLNGDGGFQMNIQEMEFVKRERLPITVIIFNNRALGMIRHFQEMYFDSNYTQTVERNGYSVPDFEKISEAYGFRYVRVQSEDEIGKVDFLYKGPQLVEVEVSSPTYVFPKLEFGKPNQDQEPLLDRKLYNELMEL